MHEKDERKDKIMWETLDHEDAFEATWGSSGGMDQISAHLERGWEQLSKGRYLAVRASVAKALEVDPDSAEAFTLEGAVAWEEGNAEKALECFNLALEIEPEFPEPMLYAAEVLAQEPATARQALVYCEQILDLVEARNAHGIYWEAYVLKAELLHVLEEHKRCLAMIEGQKPPVDIAGGICFRLGRLCFEMEDYASAAQWMKRALDADETLADAHHYMGLLCAMQGAQREAIRHFERVRCLDLQARSPAWTYSDALFARVVASRAQLIAELTGCAVESDQMYGLEYPAPEVILEGGDPRMAVYLSVHTEPTDAPFSPSASQAAFREETPDPTPCDAKDAAPFGAAISALHINHVVIYKSNVERLCRGPDELEDVLDSVLREEVERLQAATVDRNKPALEKRRATD